MNIKDILEPLSSYKFRVRSIDINGVYSDWSDPVEFYVYYLKDNSETITINTISSDPFYALEPIVLYNIVTHDDIKIYSSGYIYNINITNTYKLNRGKYKIMIINTAGANLEMFSSGGVEIPINDNEIFTIE